MINCHHFTSSEKKTKLELGYFHEASLQVKNKIITDTDVLLVVKLMIHWFFNLGRRACCIHVTLDQNILPVHDTSRQHKHIKINPPTMRSLLSIIFYIN
jgi:hypothetical protein